MTTVSWGQDFSVGIPLIDEQHKALIDHLNRMHEAVLAARGPLAIADVLGFVIGYSRLHFDTEEAEMAMAEYPDLEYQISMHNEFKQALVVIVREYILNGPSEPMAVNIDHMLITWLLDHILVSDKKFGNFMKERAV